MKVMNTGLLPSSNFELSINNTQTETLDYDVKNSPNSDYRTEI
mgnify:CR=1 FL=1